MLHSRSNISYRAGSVRRIISIILISIFLFSLCACNHAETIVDSSNEVEYEDGWIVEEVRSPSWLIKWENNSGDCFALDNGVIYFSCKSDAGGTIAAYDSKADEWKKYDYDNKDLGEWSAIYSVSAYDGVLYALLSNDGRNTERQFYILRCDTAVSNTLERVPIQVSPDIDLKYGPSFCGVKATGRDSLLIYDWSDGYPTDSTCIINKSLSLDGMFLGLCANVDGQLYFDNYAGGCLHYNSETDTFDPPFDLTGFEKQQSENGHIICHDDQENKVYIYDIETKKESFLFNCADVFVDSDSMYTCHLLETENGDLYYMSNTGLIRVKAGQVKKKDVLNLLTFAVDEKDYMGTQIGADSYMDCILYFNTTNPDYRIEITTINGSKENYNKTLIQLATSGNQYDIVDTGFFHQSMVKGTLCTDLLPYIEKDPEVNSDAFISPIFDSMMRNGHIYEINPYFSVMSMAIPEEMYPGDENWTVDYLLNLIENKDPDTDVLTYNMNRDVMIKLLVRIASAEYVDYENCTCNFECESFYQLLKLIRDIPYGIEKTDNPDLISIDYNNLLQLPYNTKLRLKTNDYIICGFPGLSGNGCYFCRPGENHEKMLSSFQSNVRLGIMENSLHKDAAWDFLRIVLLKGTNGVSVLKERFDKQVEKILENQDSYRTQDVPQISENDVANIKNMVYGIEKSAIDDSRLQDIISNGLERYFNNQCTAERAAEIIQSKASIYISEQYG